MDGKWKRPSYQNYGGQYGGPNKNRLHPGNRLHPYQNHGYNNPCYAGNKPLGYMGRPPKHGSYSYNQNYHPPPPQLHHALQPPPPHHRLQHPHHPHQPPPPHHYHPHHLPHNPRPHQHQFQPHYPIHKPHIPNSLPLSRAPVRTPNMCRDNMQSVTHPFGEVLLSGEDKIDTTDYPEPVNTTNTLHRSLNASMVGSEIGSDLSLDPSTSIAATSSIGSGFGVDGNCGQKGTEEPLRPFGCTGVEIKHGGCDVPLDDLLGDFAGGSPVTETDDPGILLSENRNLREMLTMHLDLLQEINDQLIAKDLTLRATEEELKVYKTKVRWLECKLTDMKKANLSPNSRDTLIPTDLTADIIGELDGKPISKIILRANRARTKSKTRSPTRSPSTSPLSRSHSRRPSDSSHSPSKSRSHSRSRSKSQSSAASSNDSNDDEENDHEEADEQQTIESEKPPLITTKTVSSGGKPLNWLYAGQRQQENNNLSDENKGEDEEEEEEEEEECDGDVNFVQDVDEKKNNFCKPQLKTLKIRQQRQKQKQHREQSIPRFLLPLSKNHQDQNNTSAYYKTRRNHRLRQRQHDFVSGNHIKHLATCIQYQTQSWIKADKLAPSANGIPVETPKWKKDRGLPKLHVESHNIDEETNDGVYKSIHAKPEIQEIRSLKRDLQSLKDQNRRNLEKQKTKPSQKASEHQAVQSLFPHVNQTESILFVYQYPVTAFGTPAPLIKPTRFWLPWEEEATPALKMSTTLSSVLAQDENNLHTSITAPATTLEQVEKLQTSFMIVGKHKGHPSFVSLSTPTTNAKQCKAAAAADVAAAAAAVNASASDDPTAAAATEFLSSLLWIQLPQHLNNIRRRPPARLRKIVGITATVK